MPVIATDHQRLSNWLKYEYDPASGVTREVMPKTWLDPAVKETGSVLDADGKLVTKATAANAAYILIDCEHRAAADQFTQVLLLARGYAKIADEGVIFADDVEAADKTTAFAELAKKNIFAVHQV